jgi:hypothetical protein
MAINDADVDLDFEDLAVDVDVDDNRSMVSDNSHFAGTKGKVNPEELESNHTQNMN